jgi:hypothetical protein
MKTINLTVNDAAANTFLNMTDKERASFLSLFNEILEDKRSLRQVMDDMSQKAQRNGLTPDKLKEILSGKAV